MSPQTCSLHLLMPRAEAQAPSPPEAAKGLSSNHIQSSPETVSHQSGPGQEASLVTGDNRKGYAGEQVSAPPWVPRPRQDSGALKRVPGERLITENWPLGALPKRCLLSLQGRKSLRCLPRSTFVSFPYHAPVSLYPLLAGSCPVSPLYPLSFVSPRLVVPGARRGDSEVRCHH